MPKDSDFTACPGLPVLPVTDALHLGHNRESLPTPRAIIARFNLIRPSC